MARRITIALIGDTEEERDYIKKFTEKDRMEGWERFEDGTGFTIYAANCFDPLPDINKMLCVRKPASENSFASSRITL